MGVEGVERKGKMCKMLHNFKQKLLLLEPVIILVHGGNNNITIYLGIPVN